MYLTCAPVWSTSTLPISPVLLRSGTAKVKPSSRQRLPEMHFVDGAGRVTPAGHRFHFVPAPFVFCLHCGVSYSSRQRSDYGKLSVLSSEGRSTATTVLSLSALQALRQDSALTPAARKLLSFTDNRQDASLQAGHFNDFVEVSMLHPALAEASPAVRGQICRTLLDFLRRELAINVDYLRAEYQETIKQRSSQYLVAPWAIDEHEQLARSFVAYPRRSRRGDSGEALYVSGRGGFGLYLRRNTTLPQFPQKLSTEETETLIGQLFQMLKLPGLVGEVHPARTDDDVPGYMVQAASMVWRAGDGRKPQHDSIRVLRGASTGSRVNDFFVQLYRGQVDRFRRLHAREHTAQVNTE